MKQRVISAVIALAIIIPLIIIGGVWYNLGLGVIGLIGFFEMLRAINKEKKIPIVIISISVICFTVLMMSGIFNKIEFNIDYRIIIGTILLLSTPIVFYSKEKYNCNDAFSMIGVVLLLGIAFNYLLELRSLDVWYLIYLLLITTMSDTFAHFFGCNIGKYKLCPKVSPNKTIEGFLGGTLLGTFVAVCFYTSQFNYESLSTVIIITMLLSITGQLGDLFFSAIKRKYDIKDFGKIMPGHGGILDRLDSILFVCLAFGLIIFFI